MRAIQQLSEIILGAESDAQSVDRACAELFDMFRSAATSTDHAVRVTTDRRLDRGLALSPSLAAQCLLDGRRTRAFARGALQAVRHAVRRTTPEPVDVLYAGTGPFAPLAFLIMPFLDPESVRFTLVDINPESTSSVAALVDAFGLTSHVRDVVCADATTYRHPRNVHVVISETMQRSLAEEPFVAIVDDLRPQLARGGVIVPERVTVELGLLDPAREQARWKGGHEPFDDAAIVGKVFEVDAAGAWPPERTATILDVPCDPRAAARWLALITRIVVYQDEILEPYA